MQNYKGDVARGSAVKRGGRVVFRALRSTVVIAVVAVAVAAARSGEYGWGVITRLAWAYRGEFALILVALVVWEIFFWARCKGRSAARRVRSEN